MHVHFGNPIALALLGCLIPAVLWARKSMAGLGRVRGILALALRLVILILLVLALARTQWSRTEDDMSVMYVLDRSRSIPETESRAMMDYVLRTQNTRERTDTVGMVLFGRNAALERRPTNTDLLREPVAPGNAAEAENGEVMSVQSVVSPDRTNIAAALRLALAAFPASGRKRIVLLSDGNENMGLSAEEAEVARRNGVRIDVRPVAYEYAKEVLIEKVVAPPEVERKASFEVRTVVAAYGPREAVLRLTENGGLIGSERVELKEGRNVFVIQRVLDEPGYYNYEATVESVEDTLYANNKGSAFTMVRGRGRVLLVESDPERGEPLARALVSKGLDVRTLGLDSLPLALGEIIPNDVVILSDVPASALGEPGMRAIELAVKDWGVGLVMVGGENSFGPGGYQDSPVERALPVTMDIKQRRIMPSGALVVILHTCEIPQGNYWAQQVALAALRVLSPSDEYGLLYYDWQGGVKWLFDLQRIRNKDRIAALIQGVSPADMPSFIPAFQAAHKALKASNAAIKHVVVVSDGDPAYPSDAAIQAMVADKITISCVGINPHSPNDTKRMAYISQIGKGRYYEPQSGASLPQIFIKEAATVRRALIFEEDFQPRAALLSEIVKGIESGEYPMLKGYVLTTARPLAEIPLVTHYKDPLLAHWQYGIGRSVAFASDAKSRWAADWVGWDKYGQFWAQVVRWASRSVEDAGIRATTDIADDRARILFDALDKEGRFLNGLGFTGSLITPDRGDTPLNVEQVGPGRYEAVFDADEPGTHYISLRYEDKDGKPRLFSHGLVVPYSREFRELKANERKLKSLAEATHGRVLGDEDNVFERTFEAEPRYADTWPILLLIAVLLFPFDVLVRRVFIDYAALWSKLEALVGTVPVVGRAYRPKVERAPHMTTLLSRKQLTREEFARRHRKFSVGEDEEPAEPVEEPTLGGDLGKPKPEVKPVEAPRPETAGPAIESDDKSYMGRLLRAKKKAQEPDEE